MEDRGGKPARLRAALRSRAPGIRRISDPDVLPPDFRGPACVHSHFLLLAFVRSSFGLSLLFRGTRTVFASVDFGHYPFTDAGQFFSVMPFASPLQPLAAITRVL